MKLLFKQRAFSWFCSYDIFDEAGNVVYVVKGELSWGHLLRIYDANGQELGHIKQVVLSFLPCFEMYVGNSFVGNIRKKFSFLLPKYEIDCKGWQVKGNPWEWDYTILDSSERSVAVVSKQLFNWTDTYTIEVEDPSNALYALMLVLAIDAEKCSRKD